MAVVVKNTSDRKGAKFVAYVVGGNMNGYSLSSETNSNIEDSEKSTYEVWKGDGDKLKDNKSTDLSLTHSGSNHDKNGNKGGDFENNNKIGSDVQNSKVKSFSRKRLKNIGFRVIGNFDRSHSTCLCSTAWFSSVKKGNRHNTRAIGSKENIRSEDSQNGSSSSTAAIASAVSGIVVVIVVVAVWLLIKKKQFQWPNPFRRKTYQIPPDNV